MLKVQVLYENEAGRELRILESLDLKTVEDVARRILAEYRETASVANDKVVERLILEEARKETAVLRAAGLSL